jgi:hypothetical protein
MESHLHPARFQISNFLCHRTPFSSDPIFPPLPSFNVNVEACRGLCHARSDPARSWAFKNEEPQDIDMRSLILINKEANMVPELMDELIVQRTRS